MPDGHVQSMTCSLKQSFSELRNHFSSEFNQPPQGILMIYDGMYGYLKCGNLLLYLSIIKPELKIKVIEERFHLLFQVANLQMKMNIILYKINIDY